jgi:hypothetical protein
MFTQETRSCDSHERQSYVVYGENWHSLKIFLLEATPRSRVGWARPAQDFWWTARFGGRTAIRLKAV